MFKLIVYIWNYLSHEEIKYEWMNEWKNEWPLVIVVFNKCAKHGELGCGEILPLQIIYLAEKHFKNTFDKVNLQMIDILIAQILVGNAYICL